MPAQALKWDGICSILNQLIQNQEATTYRLFTSGRTARSIDITGLGQGTMCLLCLHTAGMAWARFFWLFFRISSDFFGRPLYKGIGDQGNMLCLWHVCSQSLRPQSPLILSGSTPKYKPSMALKPKSKGGRDQNLLITMRHALTSHLNEVFTHLLITGGRDAGFCFLLTSVLILRLPESSFSKETLMQFQFITGFFPAHAALHM